MSIITAKKRDDFRKSAITELRRSGQIPAVVYGKDKPTKHIYINSAEFLKTMRVSGRNGVLKLQVEEAQTESVILHDVQTDPLKGEVFHADFLIVDMASEIDVQVTVLLVGDAKGVKEGGVLQQSLHQVTVRSLPGNIPANVEIDISQYDIGDTVTVGNIQTDEKYEIIDDADTVIASILPPKVEQEIDSGEVQAEGETENV